MTTEEALLKAGKHVLAEIKEKSENDNFTEEQMLTMFMSGADYAIDLLTSAIENMSKPTQSYGKTNNP